MQGAVELRTGQDHQEANLCAVTGAAIPIAGLYPWKTDFLVASNHKVGYSYLNIVNQTVSSSVPSKPPGLKCSYYKCIVGHKPFCN